LAGGIIGSISSHPPSVRSLGYRRPLRAANKSSGQVAYAIMSFGGFLGMGESYHSLPWRALTYDPRQDGYVVDIGRHRLEGAPSYAVTAVPNWADPSFGPTIDRYYGPARIPHDYSGSVGCWPNCCSPEHFA
jgi:hypothetical protein